MRVAREEYNGGGIEDALALARRQLDMELALLGEIVDGREVVRRHDGDAESFGIAEGSSLPLDETYCRRLLEGAIDGAIPDARRHPEVRDLEVTALAHIGAWVGVPLTTSDARAYVLCVLAHESRPALGEADVLFMRGVGETVLAALERQRA